MHPTQTNSSSSTRRVTHWRNGHREVPSGTVCRMGSRWLHHGCDGLLCDAWRRLFEHLRQLAAEISDEVAQGGDGAGWVAVWRWAFARETALAGFESFFSAG